VWGTSERHADFYYWGRSTYEGKDAFVVTWMNSQIYSAGSKKDFNTFQIIIVNNSNGNADYIINYGSMQDADNEAGYSCDSGTCLAAGFGSNQGTQVLYASLQNDAGFLYNGSMTSDLVDGGSNALNQATLNSTVPGQFIFNMVDGYVPEVATLSGAPTNFAATNTNAEVAATWEPPLNVGGSPIGSYILRYRLAGTIDWTTTTSNTTSATITGLNAGDYVFQVAAINEIGTSAYTRSYLVVVAGPVYANMVAYEEAIAFARSLTEGYYTAETWAPLATALGTSVSRTNTQAQVDAQTAAINAALAALIVANVQVAFVDFTIYLDAVSFANGLRKADFTTASWNALTTELAVPINLETATQAQVDARTAAINAALDALVLQGIGATLALADLTAYNAAVAEASVLRQSRFSPATWSALQAALDVTITRDNSQAEVDAQTAAINAALTAMVQLADMVAYDLAVSDTVGLIEVGYSPASWAALQAALALSVSSSSSQAAVDAATAAITAALAGLVVYADLTAYNAALASAATFERNIHTADSWRPLASALAVYVNAATDAQIYVDIATANILSAIANLVQGDPGDIADMVAYNEVRRESGSKVEEDFSPESWAALQAVRLANVVFDSNTQAEVDAATTNIRAALAALVAVTVVPPSTPTTPSTPTAQTGANQLTNPIVATPVVVRKIVALSVQKIVSKVLKNNVPVLNGKRVVSPVIFSGNSSQLNSADIKALKAFVAANTNIGGWLLVSGFVMFNGKVTPEARKIAADRARNVAAMLLSLGIKAEIGFVGYGAPNTKLPKTTDRKVEIRWVAAL
jgi:hypothetical protein